MSDSDNEPSTSQQPPTKKRSFKHYFQDAWLTNPEFKKWIARSVKGKGYFSCTLCNGDYIAGISAVKKHINSKKHFEKVSSIKTHGSLVQLFAEKSSDPTKLKTKEAELKISSFIAEHNVPINAVDHLVELIKTLSPSDQVVQQVSCGRTKCTALINNVMGQENLEVLLEVMRKENFSILIDESTDISTSKLLSVVVRFLLNSEIHDEFLALIPVTSSTADSIYLAIVNFFTQNNVPYKLNMKGFAADGANTMTGRHNSVKTRFCADIPELFIMKCICHSLALCASYACEKLPEETELLVREVYGYMAHSAKRQESFKEFQNFCDLKPHKLLHPVQTRLLSLTQCVQRVLSQWSALILYFQNEHFLEGKAKSVLRMLNPLNKLYLNFLDYVLPLITDLNKEYQSESVKIHLIYSKMESLYKTVLEFYIQPHYLKTTELSLIQYRNPTHFLALSEVYVGGKCTAELLSNKFLDQQVDKFKRDCLNFYVELAHQIYPRFPFNDDQIKSLKYLSFLDPLQIDSTQSLAPDIILTSLHSHISL